jgi:hypothetical protein
MNSFLPITPTDGQIFIDSEMVKWIYNANLDLWDRAGTVASIPLATDSSPGYMSRADKNLLDRIPAVPGGFGIITDTKLLLKSEGNPDGILYGDIKLTSESLDISCVDVSDTAINYTPASPGCPSTSETNMFPGLLFKVSEKFIKTMLVNFPGQTGRKGDKGKKGPNGKPGFAGGPPGDKGIPGIDVEDLADLISIKYVDLEGITDTAVVSMQLDNNSQGCHLILNKSKLNISSSKSADKVLAEPVIRYVSFPKSTDCPTGMKKYSLAKGGFDSAPVNLSLIRLPVGADQNTENVSFNASYSLNRFVADMVGEYEKILKQIDDALGNRAKEYVLDIDKKSRTILNDLAHELAMCEFNLPAVEYCITFTGCDQSPIPPPTPPQPPPDTSAKYELYTDPLNVRSMGEGETLFFVFKAYNTQPGNYKFQISMAEGGEQAAQADFNVSNGGFTTTGSKEVNEGRFWIASIKDSVMAEGDEEFSVQVYKSGGDEVLTLYTMSLRDSGPQI